MTVTTVTEGVAGGVHFNLEFQNADNPTSAFETGVEQAATMLSQALHDAAPAPILTESYATVRSALISHMASSDPNITDFNSLPAGSSIQGYSTVDVCSAQAKAPGLESATSSATSTAMPVSATRSSPRISSASRCTNRAIRSAGSSATAP